MGVREAQRKMTVVASKAGERLGEGMGVARAKAARGVGDGRTIAGSKLKGAGAATAAGLATARTRAKPKVEAARKRTGRAVSTSRRKVGYWIAGEKPPSPRRRIGAGVLAGAAGAAAAFFLDPVSGRRRRAVARDWMAARARGLAQRSQRAGRYVGSTAYGLSQRVRHGGRDEVPENDQVLAHKVESELFQGTDLPKGQININAESGVVVLRGQVENPDQIRTIERKVRGIAGVRGVENLLHLPGTPAPMHR
jgi:osmotically-inducible protein OsmY